MGSDSSFLELSEELAQKATRHGNSAHGALIVLKGSVISEGKNTCLTDNDPTSHSAMNAIRQAVRKLSHEKLKEAILYSSSEPCPMCANAAYLIGIRSFCFRDEEIRNELPISIYDLFSVAKEKVKIHAMPKAPVQDV